MKNVRGIRFGNTEWEWIQKARKTGDWSDLLASKTLGWSADNVYTIDMNHERNRLILNREFYLDVICVQKKSYNIDYFDRDKLRMCDVGTYDLSRFTDNKEEGVRISVNLPEDKDKVYYILDSGCVSRISGLIEKMKKAGSSADAIELEIRKLIDGLESEDVLTEYQEQRVAEAKAWREKEIEKNKRENEMWEQQERLKKEMLAPKRDAEELTETQKLLLQIKQAQENQAAAQEELTPAQKLALSIKAEQAKQQESSSDELTPAQKLLLAMKAEQEKQQKEAASQEELTPAQKLALAIKAEQEKQKQESAAEEELTPAQRLALLIKAEQEKNRKAAEEAEAAGSVK